MRYTLIPVLIFLLVDLYSTLPVIKSQDEASKDEKNIEKNTVVIDNHVVNVEKLNDQFDPYVRTKWDEERRQKLELLRQYYNRERELKSGLEINPFKHHENGDPIQIHANEISEVQKLIAKVTEELAQIDHNRRELFKEYEMQKRYNEQQKEIGNAEMDEEKRKQYHEEQLRLKEKHKKHEPLHHPGSKQQLEEVWEKEDHINQQFDPKTFFNLHDFDGDGVWNQDEVRSLFQKELDKMYQEGMPEDDLFERREEMERMREHVFKEADSNKNGFIEFDEFLRQTLEPQFQKDEGWKGLDEEQIYTQEDYDNYLKYHQEQLAAQAQEQGIAPGTVLHSNYEQGQALHPAQYQNIQPQQYQGQPGMQIQYQQQQAPVYQQQQPHQYQQVPVQQQQYQIPAQQQHQIPVQQHQIPAQQHQIPPQHVPRDQIPSQDHYQYQASQQIHQKPQHNIPNEPNIQEQQQNIQSQKINNGQLNAQAPLVVHTTQNQRIPDQPQ